MEITTKIDNKPAAFFKKLKDNWYNPFTYSKLFSDWYKSEEGYRIDEIKEYAQYKPQLVSEICSIVTTLETLYPDTDYDYGNETYVSLAFKLHKKYKARFLVYLSKKGVPLNLEIEAIWFELACRGFIPYDFLKLQASPGMYYVVSSIGNLVYPNYKKTQKEAEILGQEFGISGYYKIEKYPKEK